MSRSHATSTERCAQLSSALRCVQEARERVAQLEERLERERVALEEKTNVRLSDTLWYE